MEGPTANTVYIAGTFTQVNGVSTSHLALLDVNTGAPVAGFKAASTNGAINSMTKAGNRLLVGGFFTTAGGVQHQGLASLNPTTGAIDNAYMAINLSGHHNNSGSGSQGGVGVKSMEATPDGSKLVVIGNFRVANGLSRVQALIVDLTGANPHRRPQLEHHGFVPRASTGPSTPPCAVWPISPDGSYFVVAATGGPEQRALRRRSPVGDVLQRTRRAADLDRRHRWRHALGGGGHREAVYVGGHQRWATTRRRRLRQQGAVPRPGLLRSTPVGRPLNWNPGRIPPGRRSTRSTLADGPLRRHRHRLHRRLQVQTAQARLLPVRGRRPHASNTVARSRRRLPGEPHDQSRHDQQPQHRRLQRYDRDRAHGGGQPWDRLGQRAWCVHRR